MLSLGISQGVNLRQFKISDSWKYKKTDWVGQIQPGDSENTNHFSMEQALYFVSHIYMCFWKGYTVRIQLIVVRLQGVRQIFVIKGLLAGGDW